MSNCTLVIGHCALLAVIKSSSSKRSILDGSFAPGTIRIAEFFSTYENISPLPSPGQKPRDGGGR
jgi:hypothetical protein